jgi:preprotein translocase subunit YajC
MSTFVFLAQVANATNAVAGAAGTPDAASQPQTPIWATGILWGLLLAIGYLIFIRPSSVAQKKQVETLKGAKTGDKVITTSGIHGVIANVKDTTFIIKVADNVKLEIEKSAVDKVVRAAAEPAPAPAKA